MKPMHIISPLNDKLFTAVMNGDLLSVQQLLTDGGDANGYTFFDRVSALMRAASGGHYCIAEHLIKCGASINIQADNGYTALMYAALQGHVDCVKLLLECGANKYLESTLGENASDLAKSWGFTDVITLLNSDYQENFFEQQEIEKSISENNQASIKSINF